MLQGLRKTKCSVERQTPSVKDKQSEEGGEFNLYECFVSLLSYAPPHGPTDRTVVFYCCNQHISKGAVFRVNILQLALHKFPYSSESPFLPCKLWATC